MKNIFVPSKNRVENASLLKFASENKYNINIVIEPQDEIKYKEKYPDFNYIVLPFNNKGITYVRNFIKEYSLKIGLSSYWQLDDDISGIFFRTGTKLNRGGFEILKNAEELFIKNKIALGGLEYRQFAWSATKDIIENSFCDSCVWVNNLLIKDLKYREYVEGKEDRDFAMQVIKSGNKTARTTLYAFAAPANGSNAGGLKEIFYDCGKEQDCVERMVELWGNKICVPITKDSGRRDVKINWNEINSNQISLF